MHTLIHLKENKDLWSIPTNILRWVNSVIQQPQA